MRTTIYLVRHGDVHNPGKILYERLAGFPLSELGRKQADALGKFLSTRRLSAIYASPLERAKETAGIIASYHSNIAVTFDTRLLEVSTPARGMKFEDLERERWNFYKKERIQEGGERLSDIWRRMQKFFKEAAKKHRGQEIVAVSHGDPIMVSFIKHQGKRLSLTEIRGADYVDTAKGFRLAFEEKRLIEVAKLEF